MATNSDSREQENCACVLNVEPELQVHQLDPLVQLLPVDLDLLVVASAAVAAADQ